MLLYGPGIPIGRMIEKPIPITAVAATALEFLGFVASDGSEESVLGMIR
jgi:hypothetical protein